MVSKNDNAVVIVAAHKKYRMPTDELYLPLHVGAEGKYDSDGKPLDLGYVKDNTGDNISSLNPSFCELTGLYWAWKNLSNKYIGLAHYRRHFVKTKKGKNPFDSILTYGELNEFLDNKKVIVPKRRKYYIETLYSHYAHTHYKSHLDVTRIIMKEKYTDFLNSYDKVLKQRSGYMFNMMIMERNLLDEYCDWLFDILFDLDSRVDSRDYSAFQARYLGRVSEILLNVWIEKKLGYCEIEKNEILELPYIGTEKTNWLTKGKAFLKAKFFGRKYEGSF